MNFSFGKLGLPIILLLSAFLLLSSLHRTSIYSLDEAKNAECAREMMVHHEIVPTFNGSLRTDKPPLHYYFMQMSYRVFGIRPFSARFFSSIFGILTIAIVYIFALNYFGKPTAVASSLILLSSVHFLFQMQMSVPDPYLIFLLTLASFSFYEHWNTNNKIYWWLFYISIGLGILAKGPIAIAFPGITAFIYLIFTKSFNLKTILRLNPFLGLLLSLTIAIPWFYIVHKATNGVFTEGFFLDHNINRFSEGREKHGGFFLITIAYVLLGFLPFLFFLPKAIKKGIQQNNRVLHYLLINAGVIIVFFMISGTKLPNYTVPSYPMLAIVLGFSFIHVPIKKWQWIATISFCALLIIVVFIGLQFDDSLKGLNYIALFFLIPTIGAIFGLLKQKNGLFYYFGSWLMFGFLFFFLLYPKIDAENPILKTAHLIHKDDKILAYKQFNPAFVFYYQQEIPRYETLSELKLAIEDKEHVIILSREKYLEELKTLTNLELQARAKDVLEIPTTIVLRKK